MGDLYLLLGTLLILLGLLGSLSNRFKIAKTVAVILVVAGCYFIYMAVCANGIYCVPSPVTDALKRIWDFLTEPR